MPHVVKYLLMNFLDGMLLSIGFTALIIATNLANLRHLFLYTADGPWALGIFVFICGITFGAAQAALRFILRDGGE